MCNGSLEMFPGDFHLIEMRNMRRELLIAAGKAPAFVVRRM
jgi:hypothetical protein